MSAAEKICAVVVTYNRRQKLAECIRSLLDQTVECDIIIVDNASTDGTRAYLYELGYSNHQCIRYLGLQENLGGSGGVLSWPRICHGRQLAVVLADG